MRIGDVAHESGLAPSTIRYYESIGLLPAPRRQGGRRDYDAAILPRLAIIRQLTGLGFTLATIRDLGILTSLDGPVPAGWQAQSQIRLEAIDAQIATLIATRQQLLTLQQCRCESILKCENLG